ncbi:MAG: V-type ATP synthase subunit A [Elusimicrobia bacterium]|nr:V-type ATP synthase subunit A [Elusimicrobiota bacterium]
MTSNKDKKQIGRIKKISGPLIVAEGMPSVKMYEVVRVGNEKLVGEVVELHSGLISIQVYEETAGLKPGEPVEATGSALSVELGPGLVGQIFDGIQRPLETVYESHGEYIGRGIEIYGLDREKKWGFEPSLKKGDKVAPGDIIGSVMETEVVEHRVLVPPGVEGKIKKINSGDYTVDEVVALVETEDGDEEIRLAHKWPVRTKRPYLTKLPPDEPMITGQRVIDTFFPVAKGGLACIPGPFGSGKTVVQQQLAKWADADIIVYIGCGERGNEMADVLQEFPELEDPKTGETLIKRTVLIANTSNMPVAAREASIYTGTTIAEYYRDMGYKVALMADSTSRWAEALREMSGRLEEMPGEEGYPAYLSSRIAEFYERGGRVKCLRGDAEGSLTIIGAVSPPGGDLTDPVVKNTLRVVKVFWGLDGDLAAQRHFPAIHWLRSYSLYLENIGDWIEKNAGHGFADMRTRATLILQKEESLQEIVRLVGEESLSDQDRQLLDTAKMLREDFLQQQAFDPTETYTPFVQQYRMIRAIMLFYDTALEALEMGNSFDFILEADVRERIAKMKLIKPEDMEEFDSIEKDIKRELLKRASDSDDEDAAEKNENGEEK